MFMPVVLSDGTVTLFILFVQFFAHDYRSYYLAVKSSLGVRFLLLYLCLVLERSSPSASRREGFLILLFAISIERCKGE